MSSQDEELRKELNKPYSREELALHFEGRACKTIFECMHSQNYFLLEEAFNFRDLLMGNAPVPETPFSVLLKPSRDPYLNYSGSILEKLEGIMTENAYDKMPCPKIVYFASRSTQTLLRELEQINPTKPLFKARAAIEQLFCIIAHVTKVPANEDAYHQEVTELLHAFKKGCAENAEELTVLESDVRHQHVKMLWQEMPRKTPRAAHFTAAQRATALEVWNHAQEQAAFLGLCNKARPSRQCAFLWGKQYLKAVGINTPEDFIRCLESERNRRNYNLKMGKLL